MGFACNVCGTALGQPAYESVQERSVSSLSRILPMRTTVYFCRTCGHLQTPLVGDLAAYYDTAYRADADTDEADQLYKTEDGRIIYRSEHQAEVALSKLDMRPGAKILDHGCGRATTLRRVLAQRPDVIPYLFDVTEMYLPVWRAFAPAENLASYQPRPEWQGTMDVVTSFYALEHVSDPLAVLKDIAGLLKPGGLFYGIVPYWRSNTSDFIVVDHVQHFWEGSLRYALELAGFTVQSLDTGAHYGAMVVVAEKNAEPKPAQLPTPLELSTLSQRVAETARYWGGIPENVRAFEADQGRDRPAAIYGSGVYGNFIASCLSDLEPVRCFLDQSPYQQGKTILDRPVLAPEALPPEVQAIYVGLNPLIAAREMQKITAWQGRDLLFFYL